MELTYGVYLQVFIGREGELGTLTDALNGAKSGQGTAMLISGEAGLGKTALVEEFRDRIDDSFMVLYGAAASDSATPFLIFSRALEGRMDRPLFHEMNYVSFTEVFAINRAGLLVAQASSEEEGLDADIFAGMLSAVQDFVRDSFDSAGEQKGGLGKLEYGDLTILIEHGAEVFLTAVFRGAEHKDMKDRLKRVLRSIQSEHSETLRDWSGRVEEMAPVQSVLDSLAETRFLVRRELEGVNLENERIRIASNVLELLKGVASDKPVVMFLEDLHWAEESSLFLLRYLARNITDEKVLLVGTHRPAESKVLDTYVESMREEETITELPLGKLDGDSVSSLIGELYHGNEFPESFIERLSEQCEGNPLFVREMLLGMENEGSIVRDGSAYSLVSENYSAPSSLEELVHRRLDSLDPDAMAMAEYASCIGRDFDKGTIHSLQTLADPSSAVEKLHGSGILQVYNGRVGFTHALFQDVTYSSIGERWKQVYHKSIGEHYESVHEDDIDDVLYELARHFSRTNEHAKAHDYCLRAGEMAENAYAPEQAIGFYENALEAAPKAGATRTDLLERLGDVHALSSDFAAAIELYTSALESQEDDRRKAELHRKMAESHIKMADSEKGNEECEKGLALLDEDCKERTRLYLTVGWSYSKIGEYDNAEKYFTKGLKMAEALGLEKEMGQGLHSLGTTAWYRGMYDESIEHFTKAIRIHENMGNQRELAGSLNNIGSVYHFQGDRKKALEYKEKAHELYVRIKDKLGIGTSLNNLGIVYYDRGEFDRCLELWEECLAIRRSIGDKHGIASTLHNIGGVYHDSGWTDKALECYEEGLRINREIGSKNGMVYDLCSLSKAHLDSGEPDIAEEKAREALDICIEIGIKGEEAWARRLIGACHRLRGDLDKAQEYLDRSFEMFTESGEKEEVAKCQMEYGYLYKALERKEDARKAFESALEMFEEMGVKMDADRVRKELEELG